MLGLHQQPLELGLVVDQVPNRVLQLLMRLVFARIEVVAPDLFPLGQDGREEWKHLPAGLHSGTWEAILSAFMDDHVDRGIFHLANLGLGWLSIEPWRDVIPSHLGVAWHCYFY